VRLGHVLGAVDLGYRTILITDGVCSASDSTHDAMLELFGKRYRHHVETATAEEVCDAWTTRKRARTG
jgi:nicotinamidase-related amidase